MLKQVLPEKQVLFCYTVLHATETYNVRYLGFIDFLNEKSNHFKDPALAAQHNQKIQEHRILRDGSRNLEPSMTATKTCSRRR